MDFFCGHVRAAVHHSNEEMSSENIPVPVLLQLLLTLLGLVAVVAQARSAIRNAPQSNVPAWNARSASALAFAGICIFCLVGSSLLCTSVARALFPDFDFADKPQALIPAIQTLSLAALIAARLIFPEAFPPSFDAPKERRPRRWLSPMNPFGVPALFATGFFAVVVAAVVVKIAVVFLPENLREIFSENQELVNALGRSDPLVVALCVPAIAVFTPVIEEIIFRAGLYRLLKSRMSAVPAALVSSVIFALMHDAPASYLPLTLLGCVLCLAYETTGRLAAPVLVHALFNANTLLCLVLSRE